MYASLLIDDQDILSITAIEAKKALLLFSALF